MATFSCPELCHIIALSLTQTDLYQCLLVNKTLSNNLFPYLWRHITFSDYNPYVLSALPRSEQPKYSGPWTSSTPQRRIERPVVQEHIHNPWAPQPQLTEEQQDSSVDRYYPLSPPYSSLVRHGHLIETLTLECDEGLDFAVPPLTSKEEMEEMESIGYEQSGMLQTQVYIRLLCQCTNIRTLKIVGRNVKMPYRPPRWQWCGTGLARMSTDSAIKRAAKDKALAQLISAAGQLGRPLLETTTTIANRNNDGGERIETTGRGIRELHLSGCGGFDQVSIKALIQAFSHSQEPTLSPHLRVLDIAGCEGLKSLPMRALLERLPGLQVVDFRCRQYLSDLYAGSGWIYDRPAWVSKYLEDPVPVENSSSSTSTSSTSNDGGARWACQDSLQVLRISVSEVQLVLTELYEPTTKTSTSTSIFEKGIKECGKILPRKVDVLTRLEYPECYNWLYNRIASLTNLRELCLVGVQGKTEFMDPTERLRLTLAEGLDRWKGLKNLEVLDVEYLEHRIGRLELEWMVAQWPRLREIRGLIFEEDAESVDVGVEVEAEGEEKGSAAWSEGVQWLKATRPDIELSVLKCRWKGARVLDYPDDRYL
ncbi:hypothetical protein BGX23_007949 [Mortierella sp. AD031]|nr:hypothetical protein BGX23_007949 [Mortierella sp. AD031]